MFFRHPEKLKLLIQEELQKLNQLLPLTSHEGKEINRLVNQLVIRNSQLSNLWLILRNKVHELSHPPKHNAIGKMDLKNDQDPQTYAIFLAIPTSLAVGVLTLPLWAALVAPACFIFLAALRLNSEELKLWEELSSHLNRCQPCAHLTNTASENNMIDFRLS